MYYKTIYRIDVEKDDKMIISYFYTSYEQAKDDVVRMAKNRKKRKGVGYLKTTKLHYGKATTIRYFFDDDLDIVLWECGFVQEDSGKIRASYGADYTGNANYKWYNTKKEFYDYIKDTQPFG